MTDIFSIFRHNCERDGHIFEARYSYSHPMETGQARGLTAQEFISIIETSKKKTYIHDICIKCGKIVK